MSIENGVQNVQLGYLIDPAFQIENLAGKPAVGGSICVFEAGTDTKVITYQDFDGNVNPFKIPLHSDGRAVILADPSRKYDFYVYDSFNNLMFSRLNVTPNLSGNISIKGCDVYIYNTDGTLDITQQSIQNNIRRYEINTKHKSLGVEAPLYFVEDSDTATIIGFSGDDYATKEYVDSAVSSKLDITAYSSQSGDFLTDKFEYDADNNITAYNHSAFAGGGGSNYEAGDHIDITDNVISVTGLPDSADIENAISSAVTNVENKFEYNENNYITAYNNSAFAGTNYSAGDYVSIENDTISVTGLQPSGDYATHDDLSAYQPSGDYATKEDVESATSGKQDTLSAGDGITIVNNVISVTSQGGGIEQVNHDDTLSGNGNSEPLGIANIEDFVKQDDLSAYQLSGNYLSASESANFYPMTGNPSGFLTNDAITGLQPSGDYATHDDLTAYATTALVSSVSSELYSAISGISGDYELVAGSGVELVDDPNAKTTTINVTAEGTPVTAIEQMIESATSSLQPSGDYATTADLTAKQDTLEYGYHDTAISSIDSSAVYDTSAHARINTLAGRISNLSSDKLDTTAFSTVSGSFLTAHQDLSDYATTAELANKLDTTAFSTVSGTFLTAHQDISDKLDTTAFSDVSGSFLTAVPDTYLQNTDLTIVDNKITEISGVPLSAGDELPSGTMNTSALEYNAVNEISGYNGSAIAQYGAEKQWLVHDDTLVHAANSAQYALGVNVSAVQTLMGLDETVLYTGNTGVTAFTASEPFTNFREVAFYVSPNTSLPAAKVVIPIVGYNTSAFALTYHSIWAGFNGGIQISTEYNNTGMSAFELTSGAWFGWAADKATTGTYYDACIYKIIGIGRKQ